MLSVCLWLRLFVCLCVLVRRCDRIVNTWPLAVLQRVPQASEGETKFGRSLSRQCSHSCSILQINTEYLWDHGTDVQTLAGLSSNTHALHTHTHTFK